jgi:hypothetical protein
MADPTGAPATETSVDLPADDEPPRHDQSNLASAKLAHSEEAGSELSDTLVSESDRAVKAAGPALSDDADADINAAHNATRLERTAERVSRKQRGRRRKAESLVVVSQSSRVLHSTAGDAMRLDREIRVLRRQLACKLQLQNVQLKKMLKRFER